MAKSTTTKGSLNFDSSVRYTINKYMVENGFAPNVQALAGRLDCTEEEIKSSLTRLSENHGIVLQPNGFKIWVVHPFANFPTAFWVRSVKGAWWANCAWCSLGIAAMLNDDTSILTRFGAQEESIKLDIKNGRISNPDLVMHFAIPASKWWDNVIYTCATILFFRSEKEVDSWCKNHDISKGAVLSMEKSWKLAKLWYGDYLQTNWRRKTLHEAKTIFQDLGLTGSFWQLQDWK